MSSPTPTSFPTTATPSSTASPEPVPTVRERLREFHPPALYALLERFLPPEAVCESLRVRINMREQFDCTLTLKEPFRKEFDIKALSVAPTVAYTADKVIQWLSAPKEGYFAIYAGLGLVREQPPHKFTDCVWTGALQTRIPALKESSLFQYWKRNDLPLTATLSHIRGQVVDQSVRLGCRVTFAARTDKQLIEPIDFDLSPPISIQKILTAKEIQQLSFVEESS